MILTDREIKIYIKRKLIIVDPEPEEIAYQSTAVDLRLDPIISVFTKPVTVGGIQQLTRVDPAHPDFRADDAIKALTKNEDISQIDGYPLVLLRHKLQKPSNNAAFERLKHWQFLPEITACAGSPVSL